MTKTLPEVFYSLREMKKIAAIIAVTEKDDITFKFNKQNHFISYAEACLLIPGYLKECQDDIKRLEEELIAKNKELGALSILFIDDEVCTSSFFREDDLTNNKEKEKDHD